MLRLNRSLKCDCSRAALLTLASSELRAQTLIVTSSPRVSYYLGAGSCLRPLRSIADVHGYFTVGSRAQIAIVVYDESLRSSGSVAFSSSAPA